MKTFKEYVEEIKKKHGLTTDYAVAKALLIDTRKISDVMKGRRHPPPVAAYRIADLLELDPIEVIACIDYQYTTDEQHKEYIKAFFSRRMRDVAAVLLVGIICMQGVGQEASASTLLNANSMNHKPLLYELVHLYSEDYLWKQMTSQLSFASVPCTSPST